MSSDPLQNAYAPPQAEVQDPVSTAFEPASRALRLGGWAIDAVIGLLIMLPLLLGAGFAVVSESPDPTLAFGAGGLITAVAAIAWAIITTILVYRNGQTIGKKLVGIKVVRSDGSRASLARIFWLRNVVNMLPSFVPYLGMLYFFIDHAFIFDDKRQCIHDKIADTIVVMA
ncbi:MAG: RDD family protein [Gammaproteobacteria bacterium]|nr:hypothetical protein [Gammaproteobacteria bacterium]